VPRGVAASSLQLKETETNATLDLGQAADPPRPLKGGRVQVPRDDLVAEHMPLSVLDAPFDGLNSDQLFDGLAPISQQDKAIVRSVSALAHRQRLSMGAKDVEITEIRELMRRSASRSSRGTRYPNAWLGGRREVPHREELAATEALSLTKSDT
jgi:EAL domain-containing protein (putative c-di-GMP-specific phosphodiesterase class I)